MTSTPPTIFSEAVLAELKDEWAGFSELTREQRARVELATGRLAALTAEALNYPERAEDLRRDCEHLLGTLESEAALASFNASAAMRRAIGRVIVRAAGFAVSLL